MTQPRTRSPYARSEGQRCYQCGFPRDTYQHYRVCMPPRSWPAWMSERKVKRVVINGLVYREDQVHEVDGQIVPVEAPQEPQEAHQTASGTIAVCECGWSKEYATEARVEAAMRMHLKSAKAHRGK